MSSKPTSVDQLLRENFGRFQGRDFIVIKKLQKSPRLAEVEIIELITWWDTASGPDQTLFDFMIANEILMHDAHETIKRKGMSQVESFDKFLNVKGINLLKRRVAKKDKNPALKEIRFERKSESGPLVAVESPTQIISREVRKLEQAGIPKVGTNLGRCTLAEVIGKGSSCVVFKGFHQTLNIPVAIKVFLPHNSLEVDVIRSRFVAEAQALAKLNHPYIVRVLDFEPGPPPYMVLEYVSGRALEDLIKQFASISHQRASYYIYRAAVGLVVAHKAGIIHRDIKPANILITKDDEAKLTDLGMAYIVSSVTSEDVSAAMKSKIVHGTPAYIAPEQALNPSEGDVRSDIYSLGATFFHAITGRFPFEAKSVNDVIMKHLNEPLVPPHKIKPEIPLDISNCIQKMMAKDPEARFQTVEDLLPDLMTFFLDSGYYPNTEDDDIEKLGGLVPGPVTKILINTAKKVALTSRARKQATEKSVGD